MADNVAVTPGSGKTVLADEVTDGTLGTGVVQMIKIMDGTLDGTTKAAVSAAGLAVDISGAALKAGTNIVGKFGIDQTTDGTTNAVHLVAGTAIAGKVGIDQTTDGTTNKVASDVRFAGTAAATGAGATTSATQRTTLASDSPGIITTGTAGSASSVVLSVQGVASMTPVQEAGYMVTCSTDIIRPADTTAYTANDVWADSTSAPTAGGFTLTGAARASGGSGVVTDIYVASSAVPGTLLQGELHLFDSAATAVNDNAAWNLSDADAKLRVAIVPFTLLADANNSYLHVQNLNIGFTCVGSANLRYLVKVKNAYTPVSAEVLTVRAKIIQVT